MKYYLKGTGATCYDSTGLTYPRQAKVNFQSLLEEYGATDFQWERKLSNTPMLLTFELPNPENVQEINDELWIFRMLVRRHWDYEREAAWS